MYKKSHYNIGGGLEGLPTGPLSESDKVRNLSSILDNRAKKSLRRMSSGLGSGMANGGAIPGYQEGGPHWVSKNPDLPWTKILDDMERKIATQGWRTRDEYNELKKQLKLPYQKEELAQKRLAEKLDRLRYSEKAVARTRARFPDPIPRGRLRGVGSALKNVLSKQGIGSLFGKLAAGSGAGALLAMLMSPRGTGPGTPEEFEEYERRRHERDEDREEHELMPEPFSYDLRRDRTIKELIEKLKEGGLEGLLSPQPEVPPEEIPIPQTMMATGGLIPGYRFGGQWGGGMGGNQPTPPGGFGSQAPGGGGGWRNESAYERSSGW